MHVVRSVHAAARRDPSDVALREALRDAVLDVTESEHACKTLPDDVRIRAMAVVLMHLDDWRRVDGAVRMLLGEGQEARAPVAPCATHGAADTADAADGDSTAAECARAPRDAPEEPANALSNEAFDRAVAVIEIDYLLRSPCVREDDPMRVAAQALSGKARRKCVRKALARLPDAFLRSYTLRMFDTGRVPMALLLRFLAMKRARDLWDPIERWSLTPRATTAVVAFLRDTVVDHATLDALHHAARVVAHAGTSRSLPDCVSEGGV